MKSGAVAAAAPIEPGQLQPASLDLRLGAEAFRVRASFLPGRAGDERRRAPEQPEPRAGVAGRRRRGAGEGHRLYRAADGAV